MEMTKRLNSNGELKIYSKLDLIGMSRYISYITVIFNCFHVLSRSIPGFEMLQLFMDCVHVEMVVVVIYVRTKDKILTKNVDSL